MFKDITSFTNLFDAYKAASRGKHDREEVLRHDLHIEKILWRLQADLRSGKYRHGKYRTFKVYDPKERDVSAAPFTDRVVHHALVKQIEPLFDKGFIYDSYACRRGKGTHAALLRLQHFLRSAKDKYGDFYVLRADISKYFASIDHNILMQLIAKKIKCPKTRELCGKVIDSYQEDSQGSCHKQLPLSEGLPIGNLTSQLFANIYLNELDQFVKHRLSEQYYIRYMDDFLMINPDREGLKRTKYNIEKFTNNQLNLDLHPNKTHIHRFAGSERFVGYDAGLFVRRLSKPTLTRFMRRLKRCWRSQGESKARESWQQFQAYSNFAHTAGLLEAIYPFEDGQDEV